MFQRDIRILGRVQQCPYADKGWKDCHLVRKCSILFSVPHVTPQKIQQLVYHQIVTVLQIGWAAIGLWSNITWTSFILNHFCASWVDQSECLTNLEATGGNFVPSLISKMNTYSTYNRVLNNFDVYHADKGF